MKAEIRRLHSPDVFDLPNYVPPKSNDFGFLLQIMARPTGGDGEESFDVVVCTAAWLGQNLGPEGMLIGRHYLVVDSYDYVKLEKFLRKYVAGCSGSTWDEVAGKIARLGAWEFEDYQP